MVPCRPRNSVGFFEVQECPAGNITRRKYLPEGSGAGLGPSTPAMKRRVPTMLPRGGLVGRCHVVVRLAAPLIKLSRKPQPRDKGDARATVAPCFSKGRAPARKGVVATSASRGGEQAPHGGLEVTTSLRRRVRYNYWVEKKAERMAAKRATKAFSDEQYLLMELRPPTIPENDNRWLDTFLRDEKDTDID
ncbi:hypothetical protein QYE76_001375 [Lolium multiflorum]|uniref:Uncharacterized protein n=1 Tax=Lolium multiflorum TaxID=4521 RepID=A0AAD8VWW5_LOLMU|nr:hypothetical protein QYE76_001375 [Lolium multiflorum]